MVKTSGPIPTTEFIYTTLIRILGEQKGVKIEYELEIIKKDEVQKCAG